MTASKPVRRMSMAYYKGYGPLHSINVTARSIEADIEGFEILPKVRNEPGYEQVVLEGKPDPDCMRFPATLWLKNISGDLFLCCTSHTIAQWPEEFGVEVVTPTSAAKKTLPARS